MEMQSEQEYRRQHAQRKEKVLALLEKAQNVYEEQGESKHAKACEKMYQELKDGEFSIVLIGEFSSGKSSLLNAMMHERILPTFSGETTATVNFLRHVDYAPENTRGVVYYEDGRTVSLPELDVARIEQYVSTKGDDVAHNVQQVDLYLDSDYLKDGVTLVDSPGLNGVAKGHAEITRQQILSSHASIFVFSSDCPGSETDFQFLHELKQKVKTIFLVLNKIDHIRKEEGETPETVIETLKANYKKKFPEEETVPEIWPVAALPALVARSKQNISYNDRNDYTPEEKEKLESSSRLEDFESRLMRFLTQGEKTRNELIGPIEKVLAQADAFLSQRQKELDVLAERADAKELQQQMENIQAQIRATEEDMSKQSVTIMQEVDKALQDIQKDAITELKSYKDRRLNGIENCEDIDELQEMAKQYNADFEQKVQRILQDVEDNARDWMEQKVAASYSAQWEKIQASMQQNSEDASAVMLNASFSAPEILQVGMEQTDKKINECQQELVKLEEECRKAQEDSWKARQVQRQREDKKVQLQNLESRRDMLDTYILPSVGERTTHRTERHWRSGILGAVATLFIGRKDVQVEERVQNQAEKEQYEQKKKWLESEQRKCNENIEQITGEINQCINEDPEQYELHKRILEGKEKQKTAELERQMTEYRKRLKEANEKSVRKYRRALRGYTDIIVSDLGKEMRGRFRQISKQYADMISKAVEASLQQALEENQRRLEQLDEQCRNSETEKQKKMEQIGRQIEEFKQLKEQGVTLLQEIRQMEEDSIEMQAL